MLSLTLYYAKYQVGFQSINSKFARGLRNICHLLYCTVLKFKIAVWQSETLQHASPHRG